MVKVTQLGKVIGLQVSLILINIEILIPRVDTRGIIVSKTELKPSRAAPPEGPVQWGIQMG